MTPFYLITIFLVLYISKEWLFYVKRKKRTEYYRNVYLKSEEWSRKRYVVLKRDNHTCVYCGGIATEVHHKKYAKKNIGKEPIAWLVSVCRSCHDSKHNGYITSSISKKSNEILTSLFNKTAK